MYMGRGWGGVGGSRVNIKCAVPSLGATLMSFLGVGL